MQSKATAVKQYLESLPDDRRAALSAVREVMLANLDKDFEEGMSYGMIGFYVPHRVYPPGYHCDPKLPLPFAGLASQKNYMSIYLMCCYDGENSPLQWFQTEWAKTGKKLNMGRCCIRFKKLEDIALPLIGKLIKKITVKAYIKQTQTTLAKSKK